MNGATRILAAAALLAAAAGGSSCGGGAAPSAPSPPAPTAAPTPAPPPPGGGPSAASCPLGPGSVSASCSKGSSRLLGAVFQAQDLLVLQKPQVFDTSDEAGAGTGQYRVLDREAYLEGVVANLRAAGHCAQRDPDDFAHERVQVKSETSFSETYDVLSSTGYMRRSGIYVETCSPASFPVERGDLPPAGSGCGAPYPPPIARFNVKVHVPGGVDTLDSTPLVGPDLAYCTAVGFWDGRSLCPVRPEGSPERVPCESWAVGTARDTGRPGPTWTREPGGTPCTGPDSGCANHPQNQYQLLVYRGGTYRATAKNGAYGEVFVDRP